MLKDLKMHKLEALQWPRTVFVPHLFMRSYGGTQELFCFVFLTRYMMNRVRGWQLEKTRRAQQHPNLAPHSLLPDYAGLFYKVT